MSQDCLTRKNASVWYPAVGVLPKELRMSIEAILGGLIGSILTIIVTKALDMVQKGKEHEYSLQKSFFEKKLQAAEAAVAQWYSIASSVGALAALYERMSTTEKEFELEVFKVMHDAFATQLQQISQASSQIGNSILLYFDVDDATLWNYEPLKRYFNSLSSLMASGASLRVMLEVYSLSKGTKYEEVAWNKVRGILEQCQPHFRDLSKVLDQAREEILSLLRKLRMEMKKYEP
jgi:hypothetical protein